MAADRPARPAGARRGYSICAGSGQPGLDGRFPGDTDRCPACSRDHVEVLAGGRLACHSRGKKPRTP